MNNSEDFYDDPESLSNATERENMPQRFLDVRDDFVRELEKGNRVLSAGFGAGHDMEFLGQKGLEVVGIDLSDQNVEYARSRGLDARKMDMTDTDLPENHFDGIWCNAAIHFNDHEGMEEATEELYRVTSGGGIAQIAFKLGEEDFYVEEDGNTRIRHYLTSEDYAREIVSDAGYEIDEDLTRVLESGREEFDYFMNVFAEKP